MAERRAFFVLIPLAGMAASAGACSSNEGGSASGTDAGADGASPRDGAAGAHASGTGGRSSSGGATNGASGGAPAGGTTSAGGTSPGGSANGGAGNASASGGSTNDGGNAADASEASPPDATTDGPTDGDCATDCSELSTVCTEGVCDTQKATCTAHPLPDDTVCDDGNPCTTGTKCTAGACGGGTTTCTLPAGITLGTATPATIVGAKSGEFTDTCPAGQVLTGISGTYTQSNGGASLLFLASVQGACASVGLEWSVADGAYRAVLTKEAPLTTRGTAYFGTFDRVCPDHEVMVGLSGKGYGGGAVVGLVVSCAPLLVKYDGGWKVALGTPHDLDGAFKTSFYDTTYSGACPQGQVAVGEHGGYYGNIVGGIGLSCAAPSVK